MADEDGLLPVGLAPEGENDDDTRADAATLFGIDEFFDKFYPERF